MKLNEEQVQYLRLGGMLRVDDNLYGEVWNYYHEYFLKMMPDGIMLSVTYRYTEHNLYSGRKFTTKTERWAACPTDNIAYAAYAI